MIPPDTQLDPVVFPPPPDDITLVVRCLIQRLTFYVTLAAVLALWLMGLLGLI